MMSLQVWACRYVVHLPWACAAGARTRSSGRMNIRRRDMHSLQAAQQVEEAELPHHPRGFEDDSSMHLRRAGAAIHEHDGDLLDPESALPAAERHLDLETVALRPHLVERDALERAAPEALEAPGRVRERHAGD